MKRTTKETLLYLSPSLAWLTVIVLAFAFTWRADSRNREHEQDQIEVLKRIADALDARGRPLQ